MRILGIDPGLATIGFGIIDLNGQDWDLVDYGTITTSPKEAFQERIMQIYDDISAIIKEYKPSIASVEEIFFVQNITTGIDVSQCRGVIILALAQNMLPTYEYTPNEIKCSVCGYGKADKYQVQQMVKETLNLTKTPQPDDAADALAIALTCGFERMRG